MYAILDLTWKPSASETTPPVGKAPALYRDAPYTHIIRVTGGWADLSTETFTAQLRTSRLDSNAAAGTPAATFTCTTAQGVIESGHPTGDEDLLITIALSAAQTVALPSASVGLFWDLRLSDGEPLLAGKAKTLDDVTRP